MTDVWMECPKLIHPSLLDIMQSDCAANESLPGLPLLLLKEPNPGPCSSWWSLLCLNYSRWFVLSLQNTEQINMKISLLKKQGRLEYPLTAGHWSLAICHQRSHCLSQWKFKSRCCIIRWSQRKQGKKFKEQILHSEDKDLGPKLFFNSTSWLD